MSDNEWDIDIMETITAILKSPTNLLSIIIIMPIVLPVVIMLFTFMLIIVTHLIDEITYWRFLPRSSIVVLMISVSFSLSLTSSTKNIGLPLG